MFHHNCPLVVKPAGTPLHLLPKQTLRDSIPIDMLLSAVSILIVAPPSLEVLLGLRMTPYIWIVCVFYRSLKTTKNGV
jgi:hypothetical protein